MAIEVTIQPAVEPVTQAEAKDHLRVRHNDDDSYINALIRVARSSVEILTQRSLISRTLKLWADNFPRSRVLELEGAPIQAVSSVKYMIDDVETTLSTAIYTVDTKSSPGRIVLNDGEIWPVVDYVPNAVRVTYTAGYGGASDVPQDLKHAILMMVGHLYENRESIVVGANTSTVEVPKSTEYLCLPYRIHQ